MVGVRRIDPDVVEIAVRSAGDVAEALAAVIAGDERSVGLVNLVFVFRIDDQVREVERTPDHGLAAIELLPGRAGIIGAIKRILGWLGFDEGVDDVRLRLRDSHRHATPSLARQSLGARDFVPGRAAVGRLPESAAARGVRSLAARSERPSSAAEIPEAGIDGLRTRFVHRYHRAAGGEIRSLQDLIPRLAAVACFVDAAVRTVAPQLSRNA